MSKCTDKSGLVTGASGGLGRAIVLDLAADGANVIALSRNDEGLRETAALAAGLPGSVQVLQADVTDEAGVVVAIAEVEKCFGGVDYIVNNAGKQIERDFLDTTNEDWETIEATNVRGPFWVCKHGAAAMLRLGRGGSIVNVASVLSICADPMLTAYTTSKHAVLGLTRSIAVTRHWHVPESAPTRCCPETWILRWCSIISLPTRTLRKRAARSVRSIRSNASPIPPRLRMWCDSSFPTTHRLSTGPLSSSTADWVPRSTPVPDPPVTPHSQNNPVCGMVATIA